jgi:hypothetical protein
MPDARVSGKKSAVNVEGFSLAIAVFNVLNTWWGSFFRIAGHW